MNSKKKSLITPIILAGGSGTRLWPLSRAEKPKQFLNLINESSLLQLTLKRLKNKIFSDPIIITGETHRFIVLEQLKKIGLKDKCKIILEPIPKNTTAAVALGAIYSQKYNFPSNLLVLSADHYIENKKKFLDSIKIALKHLNFDNLICLGILPQYPSTKFGYILCDNSNSNTNIVEKIKVFYEKPSLKKAKELIKKDAYWNAGIFVFNNESILKEIDKFEPNILKLVKDSLNKPKKDKDFLRLNATPFNKVKSISIDNSVFEKTNKAVLVKTKFSWNDIGTFNALWDIDKKDKNFNVVKGDIITNKVSNSYIYSDKNLVGVSNLENILLISTRDTVFATKLSEAEDIKNLTNLLKRQNRPELIEQPIAERPWGYFENIISEKNFKVKKLYISPGKKLSLQQHKKRAEHWIVISGKAKVTKNKEVFYLTSNQSTFIPKTTIHRLENDTNRPLIIIEVQTGTYFGEDDIKRFKDIYGRI